MLTQYQIAEAIETEVDRMQGLVDEIRQAAQDAARTEADYKIAYAKARIRRRASATEARATVDVVDDEATVATEESYYARLLAANNLTTLREALRASQSHINALQTLSRAHDVAAP
jgi:hypothetical protein